MSFLADTHVHVYPCHELLDLLKDAVTRLQSAAKNPQAPCLLCLTETSRDDWFKSLQTGNHRLPEDTQLISTAESISMRIQTETLDCTVIAGRQVVTQERLELLALGTTESFTDGLPAQEAFDAIHSSGAIPVLAWAPGKWLGKRADIVNQLMETCKEDLWCGDSSLRCKGWPTPSPFHANQRPLLAGSDPLPYPGEETQAGGYGLELKAAFNPETPFASFRDAVSGPAEVVTRIGSRNSPLGMFSRLFAHHRNKASRSS